MNSEVKETIEGSFVENSSDLSYSGLLNEAMEAINDLECSPVIKEELPKINDPRTLRRVAEVAFLLSYALSACSTNVNAGTEENSNESNDTTTSEQVPINEETEENVESYDQEGDVPVGEFVFTPTPTLDMSPIKTPTEAPTPTATLPPLIEGGDVEDITENMEEGDVLWSVFELQKIVNGYNSGSSGTFS
ncbi:MAG: hypothetical protein PHP08_04885, partial [Candidatus Dojkabacteria bacterium]|nr:hypothetical protein [Candidatus Dojkabacteria bacterium]